MAIEIPDLEEIGWGYPKELLGTGSQTSVTIRPLRSTERDIKIDYRRKHIDAYEDVIYEIAMRLEEAPANYAIPAELEALVRHLQGWVEANSYAMRQSSKGFWMEYIGTTFPESRPANPKVFTAQVKLRFRSVRGVSH